MAIRYDLATPREYESGGETRVSWTRCGVMFPLREKDGYKIILDAAPINGELVAFPPKDRDDSGGGSGGGGYGGY